jgi:hypothetical protein
MFWDSMIGALLAIGAVMAIEDHVQRANEGLIRWTSTLGIIAYAVAAAANATDLIRIPDLAARYVQGHSSTWAAIEAYINTFLYFHMS